MLRADEHTAAGPDAAPASDPQRAPAAIGPGPLSPAAVLLLQHGAGNALVSRHLAGRGRPGERCPCGGTIGADGVCDRCRARGEATVARQPEAPATAPVLPRSAAELARIADFTPYTVEDRLAAIRLIHEEFWVGPVDEGTLRRIWESFGPRLVAVADENVPLFAESVNRGATLLELPAVTALRDRFRQDVIGLARQHLSDNRTYVTAQLERLGLAGDNASTEAAGEEMAATQRAAGHVARAQEAQRALRQLQVGWEHRDDHPGIGPSLQESPVFFDPASGPMYGPHGDEQPALPAWAEVKAHYDRLAALISGIANQNPAIFAALRGDGVDALASATPADALALVRSGLTGVLADIAATEPKLASGDLDHRDLKPLHQQLHAGARTVSGQSWSGGLAKWVGEDVVRGHESREFWVTLGLSSLAAAAFIVASLATLGSATFLIAAGIGAGIGAAQAVHSWEEYLDMAAAAGSNVRDDLGLLSAGQASGALVQAVLDTAFVFLDVFGAGARVARAGGQAGRVMTREAAERAERELAELAGREAAQQAEARTLAAAGRELGEGVVHEAPVTIGRDSRHALKVMPFGDRLRLWLCTDCALLIERLDEVVATLPATASDDLRGALRRIQADATAVEGRFQAGAIQANRLNRETNALASRLTALSQANPDIETLFFFRTFLADADATFRLLGDELARRLEAQLGREGLVGLLRDIGPEAVRGLSDLPGPQIANLLAGLRRTLPDDAAALVLRWLGESQTGAQAARMLADLPAETLRKLVMVHQRNRITAAELRTIVDRLGKDTVVSLEPVLGTHFNGTRLRELVDLDFFVFEPALQRLLDGGRGTVARELRPLANRTVAEIEGDLVHLGMRGPRAERGMRIWTHADGSVVRIKTGAEALRGPTSTPHMVREVAERGHLYDQASIIAKVTEGGQLVAAGTNWAQQAMTDWFRALVGRVPTDPELAVLMGVWGRAGHVPVIR